MSSAESPRSSDESVAPSGGHQTINRVTRILEEVVYRPGSTFAELTRAIGAPKSSVYGFVRGLIATDWLFEQDHRLYLGPAFYSLAIASGHIRAGSVNAADLDALHQETGLTAFVGVRTGDHLIYVAEAGSDLMSGFEARSNIRRGLLTTAGGKALLAAMPERDLEAYLRRRPPEEEGDVEEFIAATASIRASGIAVNRSEKRRRTGVATVIPGPSSQPIAAVTVVGASKDVDGRVDELGELLLDRVDEWRRRSSSPPREPI